MPSHKNKKITIIIPAYNEEKTIDKIISAVIDAPVLGLDKEIIIVNDGSKDDTKNKLKQIKTIHKNKNIKIFHKPNGGKGSALKFGIKKATGQIIIPQDADLELNPKSYENLIKPILDKKTQVVFGDRKWSKSKIPIHSKIANYTVTWLANFLYGANIKDEACGYKVIATNIYKSLNLQSNGFEICPETLSKIRKLGYKITNVPVQFTPRKFTEGKKINFKDGLKAIWLLIKFRFFI